MSLWTDAAADCPFIEVSMPCTDVAEMERFWTELFDGQVIFRGKMLGLPFSRLVVCGVTLVFREDPDYQPPIGPDREFHFRSHLGFRVRDLNEVIPRLEAAGAHFVLTPERVAALQKELGPDGGTFLQTDYIAPPLNAERIAAGDFATRVAILQGPDNLWVELNEVHEPEDTRWFPGHHLNA